MDRTTLTLFADRLADRALIALGAAHLIAFALFAFTLLSAAAAQSSELPAGSIHCTGDNLVEKLRRDDPQKFAAAIAEARGIENGRAIFWKVTKADAPTSWLLGTMHSADPRITKMPDGAAEKLERAATVIVENTDALDRDKMNAAMLALKEKTLLLDGSTLDQFVPEDSVGRLQTLVEARDMPWKVARHMQPWLVAAMIALPVCEVEAKNAGVEVLDAMIARKAAEAGKELVGLETIEEQFTAIASVPREFHVNALNDTLKLGPLADSMMETTRALYLQGNTALLLPLIRAYAPGAYSGEGYADFQELLIEKRNRLMAERAASRLEKGNAFMAVGALHLPGEHGLVRLLRDRGFTVTPWAG